MAKKMMPQAPVMPKPAPPAPLHRDAVERNISPTNRQELSYEHPVAAFARGKANIDAAKERNRIARSQGRSPGGPFDQDWAQRQRDEDAMYLYRHHYVVYRGTRTQKRGNIVVRKPE